MNAVGASYKQCVRCVMDNTSDSTITFDANGICNYCSDVEKRKNEEYFPHEGGRKKLEHVFAEIKEKCAQDPYDCIVGVFGGIDSSYVLYKGWQFGLRMLAIHIDDGLDNPIAVANLQKLSSATGADIIYIFGQRETNMQILFILY